MKESNVLKAICYVCIPILITIIIFSSIYSMYIAENEGVLDVPSYEETEIFREEYVQSIYDSISSIKRKHYYTQILETENLQYEGKNLYYNSYSNYDSAIDYLIIDNTNNNIYTNNDIDNIQEKIKNKEEIYLVYTTKSNSLDTNIQNMYDISENIQSMANYTISLDYEKNVDVEIYTTLSNEYTLVSGTNIQNTLFEASKNLGTVPIIVIPIATIITIAMIIYLCVSVGHKKEYDGIYLSKFDKFPLDILAIACIIMVSIFLGITIEIIGNASATNNIVMMLIIMFSSLTIITSYVITALFVTTFVKRLKTRTAIKSTLIYKIWKKITNFIKNIFYNIFDNIELNVKVITAFLGTILLSVILCAIGGMGIILLLAFWGYILYKLVNYTNQFKKIRDSIKDMYNGKTDINLKEQEFSGVLKHMSTEINDIAGGVSNAIEQNLKSERMKAELITNVSHDIKTPLTSIINYVDLLKKEEIKNEKAKEYIEILDSKSQRLKKLTEDLIEASKVSTGNVKLNMEKINVEQLINQSTAEFEDKFKSKRLETILNIEDKDMYISADSRYMYRIIENIFSNVSKYALENSRVYIDAKEIQKQVHISVKNISKESLNISAEELMQRFVRGDKSRTTEGSGLGISIAQNLTELQNGVFNLSVDGDLFKVELIFDRINGII